MTGDLEQTLRLLAYPRTRCPCGQLRVTPCRSTCRAFRLTYVPITEEQDPTVEQELQRQREDAILAEAQNILARRKRLGVKITAGIND